MLEKPNLPDEALRAWVRDEYGLPVASLSFLPLGYDANAWAYRLEADDRAYFLKVRRGEVARPGLLVPLYLQQHGIDAVLAPVLTRRGELWTQLDGYSLTLQPFVAGQSAWGSGLSDAQWMAFGKLLGQVHALPVPPELAPQLVAETFTPDYQEFMPDLRVSAARRTWQDATSAEMAAFWRAHEVAIDALAARAANLGEVLRRAAPPAVLCHADAHLGNVLVDGARLWLIDWDGAALAPRERDLMFVIGGIAAGQVSPRQTDCFLAGYGPVVIDSTALTYYRCAWALQDIASFGQQVLLDPNVGEVTRQDALRLFKGSFGPGELVELAGL